LSEKRILWVEPWLVIEEQLAVLQAFFGLGELINFRFVIKLRRNSTPPTSVLSANELRHPDSMPEIMQVMRGVHKEFVRSS
jgi:hypothetical protein